MDELEISDVEKCNVENVKEEFVRAESALREAKINGYHNNVLTSQDKYRIQVLIEEIADLRREIIPEE